LVWQEEYDGSWGSGEVKFLKDDIGSILAFDPNATTFDADYYYALEIRLVNFWNEDGDLLPDQFRKLHGQLRETKGKGGLYTTELPSLAGAVFLVLGFGNIAP
jgi:hypothetical protein